ncbi:cob(I)yrinic acid a,c-diamide adenosyltransferase [bacterium]|nr:MAG: cob(I)yrinic acid a,c-diamide adenosyltransferase [bacterium]
MPKLTRIYTRTGDAGTTALVGGTRVPKDSQRIACYGTVDECSSMIGLARRALSDHAQHPRAQTLDRWLAWTQDSLFNLGSDLATPAEKRNPARPQADESDVTFLERAIDRCQRDLEPLANFIHPGGSYAGGYLHMARTICRRAERLLVAVQRAGEAEAIAGKFLNRLSDALFVWARWINNELGEPEHIWNHHPQHPEIPE